MTPGEWTRACIALAIVWAALAATLFAYAFVRESVGALLLALAVSWLMRLAWAQAWQDDQPEDAKTPFRF
jgi:ABC-type uncharacterized transport system permease subunit